MVKTRERFGDWEVDTILGKLGISALVTLVERMRYMYRVKRVDTKRAVDVRIRAVDVRIAVIEMPKPYATRVHTITADDGSEFVQHKKTTEELGAKFFCPPPHRGNAARMRTLINPGY